jgi:hypothetical protein
MSLDKLLMFGPLVIRILAGIEEKYFQEEMVLFRSRTYKGV